MDEQPSQHLKITSPSSAAVKYTISSRAHEPALLVVLVKHLFRIIVAFYTVLATIAKLQRTFSSEINPVIAELLRLTLLNNFLLLIIDNAQWWVLCLTSLITLYLCVRRDYTGWFTYQCVFKSLLTCSQRKVCWSCKAWACRHLLALPTSF